MSNNISRRDFLKISGLTLGSLSFRHLIPQAKPLNPNIFIILSDDQRYDTMDYMPRTKARILDEGVTFTNAFCTTPLCAPSRVSILTGMYAHNHGVHNNGDQYTQTTFVERLHNIGYLTGQVGKYVNGYKRKLPEFDSWIVPISGDYYDPIFNVNGSQVAHTGYLTDILRDYALQFLEQATQENRPFLLLFWSPAPHLPADPAPGDEDLYLDLPPHRPPNFNEDDVTDKPAWLRNLSPLSENEVQSIDEFRIKQLQCLNSLDQAIESLLLLLEANNQLDNTLVVYLSDNGNFWGEHRLNGKMRVYESAQKIPFAIRYPRLVPQPYIENRIVANIDIAPTIYKLTGITVPGEIDGRSLIPLLTGSQRWRNDILLEGWPNNPYAAVRTNRYVYVETEGDLSELYDLKFDPYQLNNKINDTKYVNIIASLQSRLAQLRVS